MLSHEAGVRMHLLRARQEVLVAGTMGPAVCSVIDGMQARAIGCSLLPAGFAVLGKSPNLSDP